MSRIIKSSQVRVTDETIVRFNTKYIDNNFGENKNSDKDNNMDVINEEIAQLMVQRQALINDIENKKQQSIAESTMIISRANSESDRIIDAAKAKSQQLISEESERGYELGYEEGYNKSLSDYNNIIDDALFIKNEVMNWRKSQINLLESELIKLVINSLDKIIGIKYDEDDEIIINLLRAGLEKFSFTETLLIRVSEVDYDKVLFSKNKILALADHIDEMDIKVDHTLNKGEIIIDTSSGSIIPSISKQLEILKNEFLNLIQNEELI